MGKARVLSAELFAPLVLWQESGLDELGRGHGGIRTTLARLLGIVFALAFMVSRVEFAPRSWALPRRSRAIGRGRVDVLIPRWLSELASGCWSDRTDRHHDNRFATGPLHQEWYCHVVIRLGSTSRLVRQSVSSRPRLSPERIFDIPSTRSYYARAEGREGAFARSRAIRGATRGPGETVAIVP